jgi:hypothetical protein
MNKLLFKTCIFIYSNQLSSALYSQNTVRIKISNGNEHIPPLPIGNVSLSNNNSVLDNKRNVIVQATGTRFSNLNLPDDTHITIIHFLHSSIEAFLQSAIKLIETTLGRVATFSATLFNLSTRRPLMVIDFLDTCGLDSDWRKDFNTKMKNYCGAS